MQYHIVKTNVQNYYLKLEKVAIAMYCIMRLCDVAPVVLGFYGVATNAPTSLNTKLNKSARDISALAVFISVLAKCVLRMRIKCYFQAFARNCH